MGVARCSVARERESESARGRGRRCAERIESTRMKGMSLYCDRVQSVSRSVPLSIAASCWASPGGLATNTQSVRSIALLFFFSLFIFLYLAVLNHRFLAFRGTDRRIALDISFPPRERGTHVRSEQRCTREGDVKRAISEAMYRGNATLFLSPPSRQCCMHYYADLFPAWIIIDGLPVARICELVLSCQLRADYKRFIPGLTSFLCSARRRA